jgi:hypothetical protein
MGLGRMTKMSRNFLGFFGCTFFLDLYQGSVNTEQQYEALNDDLIYSKPNKVVWKNQRMIFEANFFLSKIEATIIRQHDRVG